MTDGQTVMQKKKNGPPAPEQERTYIEALGQIARRRQGNIKKATARRRNMVR